MRDTLGWRYFVEHRGLEVGKLDDLRALRWHPGQQAVIALMTDPVTYELTGVHRTFLDDDGTKRERKVRGKQGVIRLSHDTEVTTGLGICEGLEDGLGSCSVGGDRYGLQHPPELSPDLPVLSGIECLTIFADAGDVGTNAALACRDRWIAAGLEAEAKLPIKEFSEWEIGTRSTEPEQPYIT